MKFKLKRLLLLFPIMLLIAFFSWKGVGKTEKQKVATIAIEEKPFVIIIPSYNNAQFVEKNLHSVLTQNYANYRVIYIDDHSSDETLAKARQLLGEAKCPTNLVANEENLGALANVYNAVHSCLSEEIVVIVDGDDFLAHENVLEILNRKYAEKDVWLTYGNFLDYPSYTQEPVSCRPLPRVVIEKNAIRKHEWITTHLRSFYAGLFKEIPIQDLFYRGRFFSMGSDLAYMMPLVEMAGTRAHFVPEILYLYNRQNPLSDHKINFKFQEQCAQEVRHRKSLEKLEKLPTHPVTSGERADLVIFSFHRPMQLYALLESVEEKLRGLDRISVLYRADTPDYQAGYQLAQERFPKVRFVKQKNPPYDFRDLTMQLVFEAGPSQSEYIIFGVDDMIVKEQVDLSSCIDQMRATKAHGLFLCHSTTLDTCYMLSRHQGVPPHTALIGLPSQDSLFAWQFASGNDDWAYPNSLDMVLYKKSAIQKDFEKIDYTSPTSLESAWNLRSKKKRVGLFYARAKAMNIPTNLVTDEYHRHLESYSPQELLEKFEAGLKIDIAPLQTIDNRSRRVAADLSFISRD